MRNFIKAAALVSFLVPAISFADAPKKDAPAADMKKDEKAPADAKKDAKTPAKKDAKKDTKTPAKDAAPATK